MVNYKCVVAVLVALVAVAFAAPAPDCTEKHYDQRQNGTENYRLNIDGVVIAVAPAETLIDAASEFSDLFDISDLDDILKPPSSSSSSSSSSSDSSTKPEISSDAKPDSEKPAESPLSDVSLNSEAKPQKKDASAGKPGKQEKIQRLKNRLAHVLIPLLRKTRHH